MDCRGGFQTDGRGGFQTRPYEDVPGFCKSATLEEIRGHGYVLTPRRYMGAAAAEKDDVPFEERMAELTAKLGNSLRSRHG
jgi:type I restriction enzyme M protein